jgi:hypothetical protein
MKLMTAKRIPKIQEERFPIWSLDFSINLILPAALWP